MFVAARLFFTLPGLLERSLLYAANAASVALLAIASVGTAAAQPAFTLKPGAWETSSASPGADSAVMKEQLAKLPAQLRDIVAKNMAKAPTTVVSKRCVTRDEGDYLKSMQARIGGNVKCETKNSRSSGSSYSWSSHCAGTIGPQATPMESDSDHQLTMAADSYQHKMTMSYKTGTTAPMKTESTTSGRFLSQPPPHACLVMPVVIGVHRFQVLLFQTNLYLDQDFCDQ
jgi:Protein of unknown function (DUF3617)